MLCDSRNRYHRYVTVTEIVQVYLLNDLIQNSRVAVPLIIAGLSLLRPESGRQSLPYLCSHVSLQNRPGLEKVRTFVPTLPNLPTYLPNYRYGTNLNSNLRLMIGPEGRYGTDALPCSEGTRTVL